MDVVYVFREGVKNSIALRYSMRSLINIPHDRVFLVGDKPRWAQNIVHLPVKDKFGTKYYRLKAINTWTKINGVCESDVSDDFILFNDDYFVLKKIDSIPYYYRGKVSMRRRTGYQKSVYWSAFRFKNPLHFGAHTPIVYNKDRFLKLFELYRIQMGLDHKIVYCNHYNVSPIEKMADCKARSIDQLKFNRTFLSTSDAVEQDPVFEKKMSTIFPEKSNYEL